jgi:hypothetical protein
MGHKILLIVGLILGIACFVHAQGIRGKITNEKGESVAYANIYVGQLSVGTVSNLEGKYELKLPEGKWMVLFQYLGYHTQTMELTIGSTFDEINIQLITQDYRIPEIKVLASGEDPAYYIMRRAIAMAPYYQKQVSKYSCKVYLKGSGVLEKIPRIFEKQLKEEGIVENEPIVLETASKVEFELPNTVKQQVLAMRSSGKQNNTSPMGLITTNILYDSNSGYISPVGVNAMKTYRFKLESVFEDQGRTINKIKVIPKTKGKDVFSGTIYIADMFWNIHSADLSMEMPMGTVNVRQLYAEVNKNTWMPVSYDFDIDFSGMGFKFKYKYIASINDYQTTLNPALDHSFIEKQQQLIRKEQEFLGQISEPAKSVIVQNTKKKSKQTEINALIEKPELTNRETVKLSRMIEAESKRNSPPEPLEIKSAFLVSQKQVNNDSAYWEKLRPIPLTDTERTSFASKDSFLRVSSTPEYKDSIFRFKRKFKIKHLVQGKTYDYSIDSIRQNEFFTIPGLLSPGAIEFNTVDGIRIELPFSYTKSDSTGRYFRLSPMFAYNIARQKVDATVDLTRRFEGIHRTTIGIKAGSSSFDYNQLSGLDASTNGFYTVWFEKNYKRSYRRDFFELNGSRELINGLNVNLQLGYSNNLQLSNNSNFKLIDYDDRDYLPNIPVNNTIEPWQLEDHSTVFTSIYFGYTPRQRYRIRDQVKYPAGSKFPTFTLGYSGAYSSIFGSDSRYDLLKFKITQRVDFGIDSHFSYLVNSGVFMNDRNVYFEDFRHFNTKSTEFMFSDYENSFRLLPFYEYSTSRNYLDVHANLDSRRLVVKYLPLIKNTSVSEIIFVNFLTTPDLKNYAEVGYGINKILLFMSLEAVAGFENGEYHSAGIKFSINLNDMK